MRKFWQIICILGIRWAIFRVKYAWKLRSGFFEKILPIRAWNEIREDEVFDRKIFAGTWNDYAAWKRSRKAKFLFSPEDFPRWRERLNAFGSEKIDREIAELKAGKFWHFEHFFDVPAKTRSREHWSKIPDFGARDIKVLWEPWRFGWVFALVREFARTGDRENAKIFQEIFEQFLEENPPEQGENWKCGQEISIRLFALAFAAQAFDLFDEKMAKIFYESARRIRANLDYALSQKNNHGISECVGLICAGTLFPEFKNAAEWRAAGTHFLAKQARELIYDDGGFSQHSLNYHRVMMQDLTFAIRLMELNKIAVPEILRERLSLAAQFAKNCICGNAGEVPNWGANDGAHVFRLSENDYSDFRPHIECVFGGNAFEESLWIGNLNLPEKSVPANGVPAKTKTVPANDLREVYTLRRGKNFVFFSVGNGKHRAGHDDVLHVDIWRDGRCVVGDSGSFSYNSPEKFVPAHNVVLLNGAPQFEKISRFLKKPETRIFLGKTEHSLAGTFPKFGHTRKIEFLSDDEVRVTDSFTSDGEKEIFWIFYERENLEKVQILSDLELRSREIFHADFASGNGFISPRYFEKKPAWTLVHRFAGTRGKIETIFKF